MVFFGPQVFQLLYTIINPEALKFSPYLFPPVSFVQFLDGHFYLLLSTFPVFTHITF